MVRDRVSSANFRTRTEWSIPSIPFTICQPAASRPQIPRNRLFVIRWRTMMSMARDQCHFTTGDRYVT
jgi:hypothetical protein